MKQGKAKIGLGMVTFNRPDYFKVAIESVLKHLTMLDEIVIYNDGSSVEYDYSFLPANVHVIHAPKNKGVASAKNACLKYLMKKNCTYLFLAEDDLEVLDRLAVVGYLAVHRLTGVEHLAWSQHGPNTQSDPLAYSNAPIVLWPNLVGAWCFYTRQVIERVGYMDENFKNAYEHVEHSWRILKGQVDYGFWPDVLGSGEWLREQPGALENSSIRRDEVNWEKNIDDALAYWRTKEDCPL